jgi:hypothetical protein
MNLQNVKNHSLCHSNESRNSVFSNTYRGFGLRLSPEQRLLTRPSKHRIETFFLKIISAFGILNSGHCDLFGIWNLCFGISGLSGLDIHCYLFMGHSTDYLPLTIVVQMLPVRSGLAVEDDCPASCIFFP